MVNFGYIKMDIFKSKITNIIKVRDHRIYLNLRELIIFSVKSLENLWLIKEPMVF